MRRSTIRSRLAMGFAVAFLAASVMLLGFNYLLFRSGTAGPPERRLIDEVLAAVLGEGETGFDGRPLSEDTPFTTSGRTLAELMEQIAGSVRANALQVIVVQGAAALLVVGGLSVGVGWWLAGRSLAPVRGITATARELSEDDLSARVNLAGPDDEIKELADTFDAMLDRIENAFEAYRNFAAVASHELRTPLSVIRVEADNALAEPGSDPEHRKMAGTIQHAVERAESMIEQLMALTRSRSGVLETAPVDLAEVVGEVVGELAPAASAAGLRLDLDLGDADIRGDRVLLRVLADNLVRNAIVHNQPGGWVRVAVGTAAGRAMVSVVNSGRRYLPEDVARMLVPFERVGSDRTRGSGLGLPAAQAIVEAHHGSLSATPPREGGLEVVVSLPTMAAPAVSAP